MESLVQILESRRHPSGEKGEILKPARRGNLSESSEFNPPIWVLNCEDDSRRDETEDACIYRPAPGLTVNNLTTGKTFILPAIQLISRIDSSDQIFLFCASTEHSSHLNKKFEAYGCVKISNVNEFTNRLQARVTDYARRNKWPNEMMLSEAVGYYDPTDTPGTRHACPDQIIMTKPQKFADEREFRFAVVADKSLLEVNNTQYSISTETNSSMGKSNHLTLQLGSLTDICEIVTTDATE
ncbi:MAG: hypothetical protein HC883_01100 [Bdellovibrionaceae bacterium]|nr:hypothetical protein [Pseudobdellovibrionaceae bacterium]